MSTTTITEQRCQVCGEVVERRYPGRWGVYHRDTALGTVRGINPHFASLAVTA